MKHKHDWHCGRIISCELYDAKFVGLNRNWEYVADENISHWACSLCGAVRELKSKEVDKA